MKTRELTAVEANVSNLAATSMWLFNEKEEYRNFLRNKISGYVDMAKAFGYVLYPHHIKDCYDKKFDYFTLAKDGEIIIQVDADRFEEVIR